VLALRLAGFLPAISNPIYAKPMLCVLAYHLVFALGLACRPFVRKKICGVLPMLATWLLALQTLAVLNSCLVLWLKARPLALSPPLGFLPALRCQAAVLATVFWALHQLAVRHAMKSLWHFLGGLFLFCVCHYSMLLKPWLVLALIAGA
jgi:hypothetical protein